MSPPGRDSLLTTESLWALGLILVATWFLWPVDTKDGRASAYNHLLVAAVCWAGWRLQQWYWVPFSQASSAWKASERGRYIERQLAQRDRLLKLSPQLFEDAVAQLLRKRYGWNVERTPYARDGGWDISVQSQDGQVLVECKQYRPDKPVGRPALQKLHSAMVMKGAGRGMLITTSLFSEPAREFAAQTRIQLIDGVGLSGLMREAYGDGPAADVIFAMCKRCGALVEFKAGASAESHCSAGHPVTNDLARLFTGAWANDKKMIASRYPG